MCRHAHFSAPEYLANRSPGKHRYEKNADHIQASAAHLRDTFEKELEFLRSVQHPWEQILMFGLSVFRNLIASARTRAHNKREPTTSVIVS